VEPGPHPIDDFLSRSRARAERWVSGVRMFVCFISAARLSILPTHRAPGNDDLEWIPIFCLTLGGVLSLGVIRLARGRFHTAAAAVSIILDALLVFSGEINNVLRPLPGFNGFLRSPELAIAIVAMMASVLRFSHRLAVLAVALNAVVLGLLMSIDRTLTTPYLPWVWINASVYWIAAGMITIAATRRGLRLITEGAQAMLAAERVRQRFGAYVSAEIADAAISAEHLSLGGDRHDVAVLFSDLRGFTQYAERLAPEKLVAELNGYIDAMLPEITKEGGIVDKYIGDSIMVVFGIPRANEDDAARAIRAARGLQRAMREHNHVRARRGLPPLVQGIGVHFGPVVAGNIGTQERLQFTVIGDAVNLASRLESATKELEVAVLISGPTVEAARKTKAELPKLRSLGQITVRGRGEGLEVFCFPDDGFSHEIIVPISAEHEKLPPTPEKKET
jgi:class 3 adenylate cyclase